VFLIAASLAAGLCRADAGDERQSVWGALVHATEPKGETRIPPVLRLYGPTLVREFGFSRFEILGEQDRAFAAGEEPWLIPGGDFSLRLSPRADGPDRRTVGLELYQGKKLLVETIVDLSEGSPLMIRGPQLGAGQLIIVLLLR
jgi:hypothetical protein